MVFTQGTMVLVMYPYDATWWNVEGYIAEHIEEDIYTVADIITERVIQIQSCYLKAL